MLELDELKLVCICSWRQNATAAYSIIIFVVVVVVVVVVISTIVYSNAVAAFHTDADADAVADLCWAISCAIRFYYN